MKQRVIELDLLRGIAIIIIIAIHAWSLLGTKTHLSNEAVRNMYTCLFSMGNVLFVMISGTLLLGQVQPISTFLKKRIGRIFLPFLLWNIVYYILSIFLHKYPQIQTWQDACRMFIPYLVDNKINILFWFIHLLLALYLLTPLLQRTITSKRIAAYAIILWISYLLLKDIAPNSYIYKIAGNTQLLYYLGAFITGYYIYTYASHFQYATISYISGFLLLYAINIAITTWWHSCATINILQTCCLFGAIVSLRINTQHKWASLVIRFSRYSYLTYFLHIFMLNILIQLLPLPISTHLLPFTTAIGIAIVCFIAGWVVDFLPQRYKHWIGI